MLLLVCLIVIHHDARVAAQQTPLHSHSPTSFTVASLQTSPFGTPSSHPADVLQQNFMSLSQLSQQAVAEAGAELIVWAEGSSGMFTSADNRDAMRPFCELVPSDITGSPPITPCQDAQFQTADYFQLRTASCLAQQLSVYLMIDMCDIQPCSSSSTSPPCPSDGHFQYNTLVVFDPMGVLVVRYHKSHLFGETGELDQADPVPTTFTASFVRSTNSLHKNTFNNNNNDVNDEEFESVKVEFGIFVCFDILYPHPVLDLVLPPSKVRHFLTSVEWTNVPPTLFASLVQQSFSALHRIALVASNVATSVGNAGGGIYVDGQVQASWFQPFMNTSERHNVILTAEVPFDLDEFHEQHYDDNNISTDDNDNIPNEDLSLTQSSSSSSPSVTQRYVNCILGLPPVLFSSLTLNNNEYDVQQLEQFISMMMTAANTSNVGDVLPVGNCSLVSVASPPSPSPSPSVNLSSSSSHHSISCSVSASFSSFSSLDTFGVVAYEGSIRFKETKDPLSLQVCALITCQPTLILFDYTLCQAVYLSHSTVSDFRIIGSGFRNDTQILPQLGVDDVQLVPDLHAVTKYQETTFNEDDDEETMGQSSVRQASWSNTQSIVHHTWYGAGLIGIVPNQP